MRIAGRDGRTVRRWTVAGSQLTVADIALFAAVANAFVRPRPPRTRTPGHDPLTAATEHCRCEVHERAAVVRHRPARARRRSVAGCPRRAPHDPDGCLTRKQRGSRMCGAFRSRPSSSSVAVPLSPSRPRTPRATRPRWALMALSDRRAHVWPLQAKPKDGKDGAKPTDAKSAKPEPAKAQPDKKARRCSCLLISPLIGSRRRRARSRRRSHSRRRRPTRRCAHRPAAARRARTLSRSWGRTVWPARTQARAAAQACRCEDWRCDKLGASHVCDVRRPALPRSPRRRPPPPPPPPRLRPPPLHRRRAHCLR
jgi:hypothetical protein